MKLSFNSVKEGAGTEILDETSMGLRSSLLILSSIIVSLGSSLADLVSSCMKRDVSSGLSSQQFSLKSKNFPLISKANKTYLKNSLIIIV